MAGKKRSPSLLGDESPKTPPLNLSIMSAEDFCNWLKGYLELANPVEIRAREIWVIREHLELAMGKDEKAYYDAMKKQDAKMGVSEIKYC